MAEQEISVTKKMGRPRKAPTAVVRLPLGVLESVDDWAFSQPDCPPRNEAIATLIAAGIKALQPKRRNPTDLPPFQVGERVEHRIFGAGTIIELPVQMQGINDRHQLEVSGWRCSVKWDDPARNDSGVMDWALRLLSE